MQPLQSKENTPPITVQAAKKVPNTEHDPKILAYVHDLFASKFTVAFNQTFSKIYDCPFQFVIKQSTDDPTAFTLTKKSNTEEKTFLFQVISDPTAGFVISEKDTAKKVSYCSLGAFFKYFTFLDIAPASAEKSSVSDVLCDEALNPVEHLKASYEPLSLCLEDLMSPGGHLSGGIKRYF